MKPRAIDNPRPGYFRMKLVRGGPWVPAIIYRPCSIEFNPETFQGVDRFHHLVAEVGGELAEVADVWTYGRFIDAAEYHFLMAERAWCRAYAPAAPEITPRQPVNLGSMAPLF